MITFNELLERAKTEALAVHTPMEDQAITLLKALDKKGYEWSSGKKLTTETNYTTYKKNTCYALGLNKSDKRVWCCSCSFYQKEHYTIIEFKAIDFKENA